MRVKVCLLLTMGLLVAMAGCSTGQSGVKNRLGTITATLAGSPQVVTEAGVETLKAMDLIIISSAATAVDGRVVARTATDESVTIDVEINHKYSEPVSNIGIRVGTFGNEQMSLTILEGIQQRLR